MTNISTIEEKQLHQIWINQDFVSQLISFKGDPINVLNVGNYNSDTGGPDFKHARIKIGNLTFVGDVEIDKDYKDWKRHGHNINKNYNKVILHICYSNHQKHEYVYTSDGRKVLSIFVGENISADTLTVDVKLAGKNKVSKKFELKCSNEINIVDLDERRKVLLQLGIERFKHKSKRVYHRLKELKFISEFELKEPVIRYELTKEFNSKKFSPSDFGSKVIWNQLLYELIFEALGYSKNKKIMMKLAQNVTIEFLDKLGNQSDLRTKLESVYYNVSGLMPELQEGSNSDYIIKLHQYWNNISQLYDGKKFDETQWQFLGQRPQNFPTVRISGGASIVDSILTKNLVGVLIKKFHEINSTKVLINSIRSLLIIRAKGYWNNHFVFDKSSKVKLNYIVGLSRADEIFVNVLLPFFSVYFDIFGNEILGKKVLKVYNEYEQRMDNKIVRDVANGLQIKGLNKKTIYSQGMIELYRNYCTKNKCYECKIGEKVFT